MDVKAYLEGIRTLDSRINAKLDHIAELQALATKVTQTITDMPRGSSVSNPTENCVLKIWALQREIDADIDRLVDMKREAIKMIEGLPDERHRQVLGYRYIDGMSWAELAQKMNYAERTVYYIHEAAITELSKAS
jgi:DNA-directed RNA polymerase specialized sigma subunit